MAPHVYLKNMKNLNMNTFRISCAGISFKSQCLYLLIYILRYLDLPTTWQYIPYNTSLKLIFLCSSAWTLYLMTTRYRPTRDPSIDTFPSWILILGSILLGLLFHYQNTVLEISWAISIWLESVAILPQLFMMQRTGEAETITAHYLFALGIYRVMYIPNWVLRYIYENPPWFDGISITAGVVQMVLYSDFFWVYWKKVMKEGRRRRFELLV
ncbi:ER lumen protein retaining receptor-domain-containing protein [Pyronema domesticum]|nr:ER lumen protein retaining receptor-domain-containing protein [Pyronema domesticum]